MIDEFNRSNPHGIHVVGEYAGAYSNLFNKVIIGLQADMLPSLSVAYSNQARVYYDNDAVVDLQPYIESPSWGLGENGLQSFFPAFLEQDRYGEAQVAFPPNRSMELLYYNTDWLHELARKEHGVS
mgnify:CR=1 FL=1